VWRLKALSSSGPLTLYDSLKFYLSRRVLRMKYEIFMAGLEDNHPKTYNILKKLGLPDYSFE
jgi:hypothetical protein